GPDVKRADEQRGGQDHGQERDGDLDAAALPAQGPSTDARKSVTSAGPTPSALVWIKPPAVARTARTATVIIITSGGACGWSTGRCGDGLPQNESHHMRPV